MAASTAAVAAVVHSRALADGDVTVRRCGGGSRIGPGWTATHFQLRLRGDGLVTIAGPWARTLMILDETLTSARDGRGVKRPRPRLPVAPPPGSRLMNDDVE